MTKPSIFADPNGRWSRLIDYFGVLITALPIGFRIESVLLAFLFGFLGGAIIALFYAKCDDFNHWWDRGIAQRFGGLFRSISLLVIFGIAVIYYSSGGQSPLNIDVFFAVLAGHALALSLGIYTLAKKEGKI